MPVRWFRIPTTTDEEGSTGPKYIINDPLRYSGGYTSLPPRWVGAVEADTATLNSLAANLDVDELTESTAVDILQDVDNIDGGATAESFIPG